MKTISDYTIYCTESQTRKALELGASLYLQTVDDEKDSIEVIIDGRYDYYEIPTAEQMIGWLVEEKKIFVKVNPYVSMYELDEYDAILVNLQNGFIKTVKQGCSSPKEAVLAAIDEALNYLSGIENGR